MSCMSCSLALNCRKYSPYGGYFCPSNHVQCQTCDQINQNRCGICREATKFVEILSDIVKENLRLKSDLKYSKGVVAYFQAELDIHQREVVSDPEEESSTFTFMDSSKSIDELDILNIKSSAVTFPAFEAQDRGQARARARTRSQPPPSSYHRHQKRIEAGEHCDVIGDRHLRHRIPRRESKTKKSKRMQIEAARREEFQNLMKAYQCRNVGKSEFFESDNDMPKKSHPKELKKPSIPHTYVTGRVEIEQNSNTRDLELKYKKDSKDMRIESILKTFAEGDISAEITEMTNISQRIQELSFTSEPTASTPSTSKSKQATEENEDEGKLDTTLERMQKYLTRVRRANCMPFSFAVKPTIDKDVRNYKIATPLPQTTPIVATKSEIKQVLANAEICLEPETDKKIYISRQPVYCPDAGCRRISFISDLNKHLIHDHSVITKERISTNEVKTYFLDAQVACARSPKCHVLYLLKDKNIDIGKSEYNDLMPILLMTCKCHVLDIFTFNCPNIEKYKADSPNEELLLIWLTGLVSEDVPISANLSVWPLDTQKAEFHTAKTCNIYSIRDPQNMRAIYDSHGTMILPETLVKRLTNNGKDMIGVQVIIH